MELTISGNAKIIRKGTIVEVKEAGEDLDKTTGAVSKGLANIGVFRGRHWVYDPSLSAPNDGQEQLWLVLRNYVGESGKPGTRLQEGDIIKMGRCKYLVKELVTTPASPEAVHLEMSNIAVPQQEVPPEKDLMATICAEVAENPSNPVTQSIPTQRDEETRCRICLGNDSPVINPLISSPCKCSGTVKLIHANCLQQWLKSKVAERKNDCVVSYAWKQFECDVCKVKYPSNFPIHSKQHDRCDNVSEWKRD